MNRVLRLVLPVLMLACAAWGCAGVGDARASVRYDSFEAYQRDTLARLTASRASRGSAAAAEARLNLPSEWRPAGPVRGGILLVHGLGDSPWSFHDLGPELARQGFLVRSVLLPGHGTDPHDMLGVSLEDWRRVVAEQADLLRRDAGPIVLGGFSTGANLVLDQAYESPDVAGLLLFSPAFRSSVPFGWLTPALRYVRPWLLDPATAHEDAIPVRYTMVPTNGFAQFHRSSRLALRHLAQRRFERPVLMVLAAGDSVVDTAHALEAFRTRFPHPASRLLWYGAPPAADDPRILARPDRLPDWRISQFSHMGLLFSPDNELYGRHGTIRLCRNGPDEAATRACREGAEPWFSDWGYHEEGKVHARLTFNPYFAWQAQRMSELMDAALGE